VETLFAAVEEQRFDYISSYLRRCSIGSFRVQRPAVVVRRRQIRRRVVLAWPRDHLTPDGNWSLLPKTFRTSPAVNWRGEWLGVRFRSASPVTVVFSRCPLHADPVLHFNMDKPGFSKIPASRRSRRRTAGEFRSVLRTGNRTQRRRGYVIGSELSLRSEEPSDNLPRRSWARRGARVASRKVRFIAATNASQGTVVPDRTDSQ